jgi:hypothetical protein
MLPPQEWLPSHVANGEPRLPRLGSGLRCSALSLSSSCRIKALRPYWARASLYLQAFFMRTVGWCVWVVGYPVGTDGPARDESPSEDRRRPRDYLPSRNEPCRRVASARCRSVSGCDTRSEQMTDLLERREEIAALEAALAAYRDTRRA